MNIYLYKMNTALCFMWEMSEREKWPRICVFYTGHWKLKTKVVFILTLAKMLIIQSDIEGCAGTPLFLTTFIYLCVVGQGPSVFGRNTIYLCSPGLGPAVFETWVVLSTRDIVLPQLSFCHLCLLIEWFGGSEASCEGRLEASEFFRELVT